MVDAASDGGGGLHAGLTGILPDKQRHHGELRRFLIEVAVVLIVFTALAFTGMYGRTEQLVADTALEQARSLADLVVALRSWNASYGGVWVDKVSSDGTNPFLRRVGVAADATTTVGQSLTLRNPAIMTREVSVLMRRASTYSFRLTSLKPVNPTNAPDEWERTVLVSFESGVRERWRTDRSRDVPVLRYMRPLAVEASCLRCHADQGYAVGDIRGAISVEVPLAAEEAALRANAAWLAVVGVLVTVVLLSLTTMLVRRLERRLAHTEAALVDLATIDTLTRLPNRRVVLERLEVEAQRARRTGASVSVAMMDIDRFKSVNDTLGHAAGDVVLREVAARLAATSRAYDIVGRFGGEEFLLVAPGADADVAAAIAERMRAAVTATPIVHDGGEVPVTLSAGVSQLDTAGDDRTDDVLVRADRALYRSKEAGRDRVTVAGPDADTEPRA